MSLDERQLTDHLSRYAEGVTMTSTDLDRMHTGLRRRLQRSRRPRRPPRRRVVLAAVAAVLLVAAAVGGVWWLRRPDPPVPATPNGSMTGLWKFTNPLTSSLFVIRADNSISEYPNAQALVQHVTGDWAHITYDTQHLQVDGTNAQGQECRGQWSIASPTDGLVQQGQQTYVGPGCDSTSGPASTLTRLTPQSAAAQDLPVPTEGPAMPVTAPVQLDGVWLLQGTGVVLAVDERANPETYVLDDDGDIDTNPDARGPLTVEADGEVTLQSPGCDTRLQRAEVRGQGSNLFLAATVTADPCGRFGGHDVLTWIRVL